MQNHSPEEKIKPFRLVKAFTVISFIVMFIGTIVLSGLNAYWVRTMLVKKSEAYAILLAENLNHQVFLQFIIPVALKFGKIHLRNKDQFERMDTVVRSTLHTFKVDNVNIYDMDNTISYSFDTEMIGKKNVGGTGYLKALSGKSSSNLIQTGSFWEILTGFPEESKMVTFAPLRAEKPLSRISGPVLGVVEIVQDLSDDYQTIFESQIRAIQTCACVMIILFLILRFVVKRGEGVIQKRTMERLRLKEELEQAKHLSSIGEMTAGISHEIRNPLGIISSSAELLKKKMGQMDPTNTIPDIIVEEAGRLNNIITDFLNFAKPKTPNMLPCRIDEIIEKNITYLEMQFRENKIIIEKLFDDDLKEITADADMLYQAFLNIFINSIQAMPDGGKLTVKIVSKEDCLFIHFKDEGKGIPENDIGKIWNPFFTTKEKGTGLGLGIVKNIINSHKGNITIKNRSVCGVCVTIELPLKNGTL